MGSIYKITNTVNGKAYIGQTRHDAEKTRIRDHFNGHGNRILKNSVKKYGRDAFTVEILHDGIIPELLDILEIEAIAKHNTVRPAGYNLTTGGGAGTPSEETRRKLSEAGKGRIPYNKGVFGKRHSKETRRKISEGQKGKKFSEETKRKISEAKEGKPISRETRSKMSESKKGKKLAPETRRKISESRKNPEHIAARAFLGSLSSDITTDEKRRRIYQKFPNIPRSTVYRWCKKFDSET